MVELLYNPISELGEWLRLLRLGGVVCEDSRLGGVVCEDGCLVGVVCEDGRLVGVVREDGRLPSSDCSLMASREELLILSYLVCS